MTTIPKQRAAWLPFVVMLVAFTGGAFLVGRRSAGPAPAPPAPQAGRERARTTSSDASPGAKSNDPDGGASAAPIGVVRLGNEKSQAGAPPGRAGRPARPAGQAGRDGYRGAEPRRGGEDHAAGRRQSQLRSGERR